MKKHVIWGNWDLDINDEDFQDFLKENYPDEDLNENQQWDILNEENMFDHECEVDNLKDIGQRIHMKHNWHFESILVIGDLGLWHGRVTGYKFIYHLEETLYSECDYYELYCDGHHLRAKGAHHDGNNSYTFLLFSGSENEWDNTDGENKFLEDLYYGRPISKARWHKYTRSIAPYIKEYYGW